MCVFVWITLRMFRYCEKENESKCAALDMLQDDADTLLTTACIGLMTYTVIQPPLGPYALAHFTPYNYTGDENFCTKHFWAPLLALAGVPESTIQASTQSASASAFGLTRVPFLFDLVLIAAVALSLRVILRSDNVVVRGVVEREQGRKAPSGRAAEDDDSISANYTEWTRTEEAREQEAPAWISRAVIPHQY